MQFQKSLTLNLTYLFIIKIPNKWELEQIALNDSSNIDFMNFMNFYKKSTTKSYTFLVINTTLASDIPLSFRNNCQERIKKQAKFTYYPLGNALEKQVKAIEDQGGW